MNITRKKFAASITASIAVTIIVMTWLFLSYNNVLFLSGNLNVNVASNTPIHGKVSFYRNGVLVASFVHPGEVTNIGLNYTLYKLFGNSTWQYADLPYLDNATYISIGNQGALSQASTVLPGEWNRTAGTISKNTGQSVLNISCTFYPAAGPYTADCIGLNLNATASANNLWAYDTFVEVGGIDDTFTINVEFEVTISS